FRGLANLRIIITKKITNPAPPNTNKNTAIVFMDVSSNKINSIPYLYDTIF
ncbi:hypothetical protein LCGC14_1849160, partial [marine sediment metagenome]